MSNLQAYFQQLGTNIRLADVLDVGVIALLLYCGLSWFRLRASRSLVIGMALVGGIFLAARSFNMYLTIQLFQAGFIVATLALIVVFQQDIRRAFEKLAAADFFGRSSQGRLADGVIETLVECMVTLSEHRNGALLVFEGREPLDRQVRGGVAVDGRISLPLLISIFHPHSPGHDGAVLIKGDRIDKLGVHLPLSSNLSEIGPGGTRHAAALGLSERNDAIVLVVSEERGTISIAEHGKLREIKPAELTLGLEAYYRDRFEPVAKVSWHHRLTHNLGMKLTALSLACALWLLFAYRIESIQRTFVVPIEYRNLPENWIVEDSRPSRAELTLSGSERAFDSLDADSLAVSLDLSHVRSERTYYLPTDQSVKGLPAGLTADRIQPSDIAVVIRSKAADNQPGPKTPD